MSAVDRDLGNALRDITWRQRGAYFRRQSSETSVEIPQPGMAFVNKGTWRMFEGHRGRMLCLVNAFSQTPMTGTRRCLHDSGKISIQDVVSSRPSCRSARLMHMHSS
jgi:hypothetical protein